MPITWVERVGQKQVALDQELEKLLRKYRPPPPPPLDKGKGNGKIDLLAKLGLLREPAPTFNFPVRRTFSDDTNPFRTRPPQTEPPFREPPPEDGDTNPFRRGRFPAGISDIRTAPFELPKPMSAAQSAVVFRETPYRPEAERQIRQTLGIPEALPAEPRKTVEELLGREPRVTRPYAEMGAIERGRALYLETASPIQQFLFELSDIAGLVLVAQAGVQGVQALTPVARQAAGAIYANTLGQSLDRMITRRAAGIPREQFNAFQNQVYDWFAGNKPAVQESARNRMLARLGRTPNVSQAMREAADDTVADVERGIAAFIPKGTVTGALSFGGRTPTPESVAFKIAQGQTLTKVEEQLRVNNPQGVETALNQLKATATPAPEVAKLTSEEIQGISDIIDTGVFKESVSQSIQKDGQKLLDAVNKGDTKTIENLMAKYVKEVTKGISGGAGPKPAKPGRAGGSAIWNAARKALDKMKLAIPKAEPVMPQAIQPTETGGMVAPTQPPVPLEAGGEGGLRPPLTTLPPAIEPTPAVTAEPQAQRVVAGEAGVPPSGQPPVITGQPPIPEPTPPSGRPRTLADLNREAKGMRALKPEERAAVMDIARPISEDELLYKVKPFEEHARKLLQPDTPIKEALRSLPGIKQVVRLWTPAQMERDNPIAMIGVRKQIFEEIEIGRARLATLNWWHDAEDAFSFKQIKGKWRATNVELTSRAQPSKPYHATIHDLVEHPENYSFTPEQQRVLQIAQDMQRQIMRDAQRAGVDAVELFNDYWRRIVIKAPSVKIDAKTRSRIAQRKGYTRQRVFDFVDEGAKTGYEYETHPLTAFQNRLEAGIRTISDQNTRQAMAKLPGVEKPLERLESRYPQTVEGAKQARQTRDAAKTIFLRDKTVENEIALRQAEADFIMAMREVYAKKLAVGQPNIGELKLPNGRIAPAELVDEVRKWVDLPEIQTSGGAISSNILEVTRLLRTTLTNVDLAAGFIQGQALFYRNNVAWWRGQANALVSLIDDPTAYVAKNFDLMDEGMRMGAISIPTEFLFTQQGLASIPTRIPVIGPVMKAFNRAFEWFILTGQTELYKAARGAAIRRAGGDVSSQKATDALVSLGSAIRKELGTESYAILGVRPTQHTAEQLLFFAARFFRALTGFQAQAFTGGEAGHEARRSWAAMLAGGLALTIAISYLKDREMPNLTDPFKPGWMSVKIGKTYFNAFGPFYPYLRTQARVVVYVSQGRFDKAAGELNRFMKSKAGLPLRGIDMAAQFGVKGYYTTFEGKTIPKRPLGIAEAALGEFAVPISIQEALKSLPEGRPESAIAEIFGLVGRENYPYFPEEMLASYFDIPTGAIELRAGKEDGTIEFSRAEYRAEFPPIDAMLFLKGYVNTIKTEEARQFVLDIVRREGYDPRQLRAVKKWQGEQDKLKELGLEDENITLTDSLIMELLGITAETLPERTLPERAFPERAFPERALPERVFPER